MRTEIERDVERYLYFYRMEFGVTAGREMLIR